MFFPGETITHTFVIPFNYKEINKVVVSYKQLEGIILEKAITSELEFIKVEDNLTKIEVTFTQLDSMLFADNADFTIQLNVYLKGGTRHSSHEMKSSSGIQYLREVVNPVPLEIISQPTDCGIRSIGEIAQFIVAAQGVFKYQWQQSIDNGEWHDILMANDYTLQVISSEEIVNKYTYRCFIIGTDGTEITTNTVKIIYAGGGS